MIDLKTYWKKYILLALITIIGACSSSGSAPELEQAARVFQHMTKPSELSRSVYPVAFPETKPSTYVSYLFSGMGTAEWPIAIDDEERAAMQAAGIPILPQDVAIIPLKPDASKGKQLVIRYDDGRNVVIAEGYTDPKEKAVFTKEWSLPKVTPSPLAKGIYESNRDLGMSFQKF